MGGNSVNIIFGAQIEGLIEGVEEVKGELESLASFTEGITSAFTGIGEAITAAFGVEQIFSFAEHISQLGSKLESVSAQLGISTQETLGLEYAAKLADTSIDQAARSIDRFYMSVQMAQEGSMRQMAALNALGISAATVKDKNVDLNAVYETAITRLGQMNDGQNKTLIIMDLFGNRSAQTARLINVLSDGMGDLAKTTEALDAPTQKQLDKLREIHVRIVDLETVWENFKMRLADVELLLLKIADKFVEFVSKIKLEFDILVDSAEFAVQVLKNAWKEGPQKSYSDAVADLTKKDGEALEKYQKQIKDTVKAEADFIQELEHPKNVDAGTVTGKSDAPHVVDPASVKKDMQVWEDALTEMLLKKQEFGSAALQDELQFWQSKLQLVKKGTDDYFAIEKKIYEAEKQLNAERLREDEKLEREEEQRWNKFFNSFNSGLMSMIKGTGSWRDFMRNAFFNVLENGLKMMEKLLAHWIVTEQAKTSATVAGNAARSASNVAADKSSSDNFSATALGRIQGDAAKAYAGVYGWAAPEMGPLAAIPAAAAYVAVIGMEALVPSFDVGSWGVRTDGLAMLHEGEQVLTRSEAEYGTGRGGGSGMTLNIYGGINDRQSIRKLLMEEGTTIRKSVEKQAKLQNKKVT